MKRILLLLLLACIYIDGSAQQGLKIESFRYLENDLTAITSGTERRDQNGIRAALIKIITPEKGFEFDGGMLGVVDVVEKVGEIWLYIPQNSLHLSINHRYFGKLNDYNYPMEIISGRTYEMRLDIGTGRYVNITSSIDGASVKVDGRMIGESPIYNYYLSFGKHSIDAVSGQFEGNMEIDITQSTEKGVVLMVPMIDITDLLGEVEVEVDNGAEIIYGGDHVGAGVWRTQLKEGEYIITTALPDCDTVRTAFKVLRQQQNLIKANTPIPHTGFVSIYVRPHTVNVVCDDITELDISQTQSLTVGLHELSFSHKGYNPQTRSYIIERGVTLFDTVTLDRMKYVRPVSFYFGAGYTLRSLPGVTAILGTVLYNHDLQLSYTFGMGSSGDVYWYDEAGKWQSTMNYSRNSFSVRYGYQFMLIEKMAITPYVSYSLEKLKGTLSGGVGSYADDSGADMIGVGTKIIYVPFKHINLYFLAGYDYALSMDGVLSRMLDFSDFGLNGFNATAGLMFSF